MTITQWLARKDEAESGTAGDAPLRRTAAGSHPYQELKSTIHRRLIDRLDLSTVADLTPEQLSGIIKTVVENMIAQEGIPLSRPERDRLVVEIQNETMGLGPLEPLLADIEISDIMVNGPHGVFVERRGKIEKTDVIFKDNEHLMAVIERIVSKVGRRVDEASPMVDARLADGSRVNVIIPPLAIDGPSLSIRRFGVKPLKMENLLANGSLTGGDGRRVRGDGEGPDEHIGLRGTGAGKTTFLNVLSSSIPDDERIITVEDAAELILQQEHTVRLETRPPNIEGKGAITQRDLVRNALRMRPDRIIVGEVRGGEALDMLQAMNTGHDGSISTIHANAPRDALSRIETMVLMAGFDLPSKAIREQIASALNVILQLSRMSDGTRKVVTVSEVTGMEGDVVVMQDIFVFEKRGVDRDGKVLGEYRATGVRPKFLDAVHAAGIHLGANVFAYRKK